MTISAVKARADNRMRVQRTSARLGLQVPQYGVGYRQEHLDPVNLGKKIPFQRFRSQFRLELGRKTIVGQAFFGNLVI